jgi:hypothetical protein
VAPTVEPTIVTIVPWPHFQAFIDSQAAIGAQLYSYVPATSTPKATWKDPAYITPNTWPVVLGDQGAATVYLQGTTDLRLFDADSVMIWSVDAYEWSSGLTPGPGDLIMGSTEATLTPTPGAAQIIFPDMAPAGYRVKGVTWTSTNAWGTANGLAAIALGDSTLVDRWAVINDLSQGVTGGQLGFHAADQPIAAPAAYTLLATAIAGTFDGTGSLHAQVYWETLPADVP